MKILLNRLCTNMDCFSERKNLIMPMIMTANVKKFEIVLDKPLCRW